jgi:hypothetical protein
MFFATGAHIATDISVDAQPASEADIAFNPGARTDQRIDAILRFARLLE